MENESLKQKAQWWDVVGMILTLDKRLFIVIPAASVAGYFCGKIL